MTELNRGDKKCMEVKLREVSCIYEVQSKVKWRVDRISEKKWSEVNWNGDKFFRAVKGFINL